MATTEVPKNRPLILRFPAETWQAARARASAKAFETPSRQDEDDRSRRLVILDLNGFLIHRVHKRDAEKYDADFLGAAKEHSPFYVWSRPHAREFLQFLFQHFTVAIWTSAQKRNAENMLDVLFDSISSPADHDKDVGKSSWSRDNLLFVWGQEQCNSDTMSAADFENFQKDQAEKPPKKRQRRRKRWLFTKPLAKVWEAFPQFNATNTLIIDDSDEKMIENPPGLHYCPETWTPTDLASYQNDYSLYPSSITNGHQGGEIYQWLKGLAEFSVSGSNVADHVLSGRK